MRRFLPSLLVSGYYAVRQWGLHIQSWRQLLSLPRWRGASLAIVGNAGYLADHEQGALIDGHNLVLRMNNFQTQGLERHVGSRTDVFFSSFFDDVSLSEQRLSGEPLLISSVPNNFRKEEGLRSRHGEKITAGLLKLRRQEAFAPDLTYFQEKRDQIGSYPTTGAMALFLACEYLLEICGRIFVTGFSFFEGRTHYFSQQQVTPVNHNTQREREVLGKLLQPHLASGRIQLDPLMLAALTRPQAA